MKLLGVLMAIVIATGPAPTTADWAITAVFGPAVDATIRLAYRGWVK